MMRSSCLLAPWVIACGSMVFASTTVQPPASGGAAAAPAPVAADAPTLKPEEIEQLVAPIALYPDDLLAQIFMAATYPLELVEADRWVKSNKLTGDAMAKDLEEQKWDASVKSLVNFPDVLNVLTDKITQTQALGDAFLADQKAVMAAVQKLRGLAKQNGQLQSNDKQNVTVEGSSTSQTIIIQSSSPDVVYVPTYNPTVVYGAWPYPAYPPHTYYPPGYVASNVVSFGVGVACGAAWGYAWGNCNWHGGDVNVNVNRNVNRNTNINRANYTAAGQGAWQHDAAHRQGVGYRDAGTAGKYGGQAAGQSAKAREAYRGQGGAGAAAGSGNRPGATTGQSGGVRQGGGASGGAGSTRAPDPGSGRSSSTGATRSPASSGADRGAMGGSGGSAGATRAASSRGASSRAGGAGRSGGR